MTAFYQIFKLLILDGRFDKTTNPEVWVHLCTGGYMFDSGHQWPSITKHVVETRLIDPEKCVCQLQRKPKVGECVVFTLKNYTPICAYFFIKDSVLGQVYFNWDHMNLTIENVKV